MHYLVFTIGICWIGFWLYWVVSALKSKRNSKPSNSALFFGPRAGLIVVAAVLTLGFDRLPLSFRDHAIGTGSIARLCGAVFFALGLWLAIWARVSLGNNWGMPMTEKQRPELVTSGIYHYVRHPIYTGFLTMALGSALSVNAYWLLVFAVSALYFVFSSFVEERNLMKQFGKPYAHYRRTSKMFIPFLF